MSLLCTVCVQGRAPWCAHWFNQVAIRLLQVTDHINTRTVSKDHFLAKALIALVAEDHCFRSAQSLSKVHFLGDCIPGISLPLHILAYRCHSSHTWHIVATHLSLFLKTLGTGLTSMVNRDKRVKGYLYIIFES